MVKRYATENQYEYMEQCSDGSYVTHEDYVALQKERDALAAYVEQMHASIDKVWNADNDNRPKWWTELLQVMRHKPVTALAAHDAEVVRVIADKIREGDIKVELPNDTIHYEWRDAEDWLNDYADSLEGK